MLGQDPPRRPPQRNALTRSKSCQGPTRRKRGREVLEDITWIVNDASSWQHDRATAPAGLMNDDGVLISVEEAREDDNEQPIAGPSNTRLLGPPSAPTPAPALASSSSRSLQAVNMARARSDTSLPSLDTTHPSFSTRVQSSSNNNSLINAPRASVPRITNLDSSSPPSSPHSASRYGYLGYGGGDSGSASNRNAGLGLGRAATLPYLTIDATSSAPTSRRASSATSPSLRAPPPLRRTSSSSSASSMDGTSTSTSNPAISPALLGAPFSSRPLERAATLPAFVNSSPWSDNADAAREQGPTTGTARVLPIPTIQREMPSPERKRSRRASGRVLEEDEDEDTDEDDDSEDDE